MSWVRNLAALVALAAIAFAVGDWASHPNLAGAVAIMLLIVVFAVLLSFLFRPEGEEAAPEAPREPRRRSRRQATAVAGWGAEEAAEARNRRSGRRSPPGGQVDINRAGEDELAALPGVGSVAAGRIVTERDANGPFATVSDLARVPGLHPAKVRALADRARV